MKCAKHSDVETSLTCGRCEKPVCLRCMTHTDVGIRCRDCAPARPAMAAIGAHRLRNIVIVVGLIFVAVVLIGGGSELSGGSSDIDDYQEYVDEELAHYEANVTVDQFVDPWQPASPDQGPAAGRRFVALEVTVEYPGDRDFMHYVNIAAFKLIDREDFAYGATESLVEPALSEGLELAPGEKTRGWVMFEIGEETGIKSVGYGGTEVALPEQTTEGVAGGETSRVVWPAGAPRTPG